MEAKPRLPLTCPSCSTRLKVQTLFCSNCTTNISGTFPLPLLARLSEEEQGFVLNFVKSSGSLKEMAKYLNLSYPSVRNLLDDIISKIENLEHDENSTV